MARTLIPEWRETQPEWELPLACEHPNPPYTVFLVVLCGLVTVGVVVLGVVGWMLERGVL